MPKIIDPAIIDAVCEAVPKGITMKSLSEKYNIDQTTLRKYLKQRGIVIPHTGKKPIKYTFTVNDIKALYEQGKTIQEVADALHCSKALIEKRLYGSGIKNLRTTSEIHTLRWSKISKDERRTWAQAIYRQGKNTAFCSAKAREKAAQNRESKLAISHIGVGEREILAKLNTAKIPYTFQKAIGQYNIDIVIDNLAIEIHCGGSRYANLSTNTAIKFKKLFEAGLRPICIEFQSKTIIPLSLDYVLSFISKARQTPPEQGEFWVLRCCRLTNSPCCNHSGHFTTLDILDGVVYKMKTLRLIE